MKSLLHIRSKMNVKEKKIIIILKKILYLKNTEQINK